MLVAYLIMLREGIEAALIIGIIASYLKQSGRAQWMPMVWLGVGLACLFCIVAGLVVNATSGEFPQRQQELFEGLIALLATTVLTSMVFWMKKAAHSIKAQLHDSINDALQPGNRQGFALVGMAFFAVGREGLESVFFLLAVFQQSEGPAVPTGAILGLASAVGVGFAIYYGGVKLDLRRFFRWTGVFILFVAAGLLAGALRAFHEAGLWNRLQDVAFDLSSILPVDGVIGTFLTGILGYQDAPTVGEAIVYFTFLLPMLAIFWSSATQPIQAPRPV